MKHIKNFQLFEAVPQDGFHNRFFKDPEPGLTNFTEICITTDPVDKSDMYQKVHGEPGSKTNPSVEVIKLKTPYEYKSFYAKKSEKYYKLYVYKIHYQGERYADSGFPNQMFMHVEDKWRVKYDDDKGTVFSPYPLSYMKDKCPQPVYDYFDNYKGEKSDKAVGLAEVRPHQSWFWKRNIHNYVNIAFEPDGTVDFMDIHNDPNPTIEIKMPDWVGKNVSDQEIKDFFSTNYPDFKQS